MAALEVRNEETIRVAVIGCGAFGTAMAMVAARKGHSVTIYARDEAQVSSINTAHRNPRYLSDFELPENIIATSSVEDALDGASLCMLAIPAQKIPDFMKLHKEAIPPTTILCNTSKGLYLPTKQLLSEAILEALGRDQPLAILSGPSFAIEIMRAHPTAVTVASKLLYNAVAVQRWLSSMSFRIYTTQDTIGVELGGALKNPLAVGAGMIEGQGLGINTLAAFVTRSSRELSTLCVAMGGNPDTVSGLSGIGDLCLTCFGDISRNRACGQRLVKGETLEDILATTTVEGVPTAAVAVFYAELCGLDLPLFSAVHAILDGKLKPEEAQQMLMGRPLGRE